MDNDPFANLPPSASQIAADAKATLDKANAAAAAYLAELQAKDAANGVAANVHQMPSEYAPGEGPRDPKASVAAPGSEQLQNALDGSFKPAINANGTFRKSTLPVSHKVDFAQKIRDAQKYHGSH